jgi:hypothetical protein
MIDFLYYYTMATQLPRYMPNDMQTRAIRIMNCKSFLAASRHGLREERRSKNPYFRRHSALCCWTPLIGREERGKTKQGQRDPSQRSWMQTMD